MPKYQLRSFFPKGVNMPEQPTKEQVRERLAEVLAYDHGVDDVMGAYVVSDRKPRDFEEYSAYWVEI